MPDLATNLSRCRKARNLSQEQLAEAAGVGVDTISRIERGTRSASRPSTVHRLASALGTTPASLLGVGDHTMPSGEPDVTELRRAVTATSTVIGLDTAEAAELLPAEELAESIRRAWRSYVGGRHHQLLAELPALLFDARRRVHAGRGDDVASEQRLLSTAYRLAAGLAGRLDLGDLAWTSAERAIAAAESSDEPDLQVAISHRYLVWTLIRQGRSGEAERVAVAAAERIEPRMLEREAARVGVFGNLLFNAARAALANGDSGRSGDLLAVANAAAVRAGVDHSSEAAIFGPRVAAFQSIEHAARVGDPGEALHRAGLLPAAQGRVPAFWEAGHRLHLALAAVRLRRDHLALDCLAEAMELAPEWARAQSLGTTVMAELVDKAARRRDQRFADLAACYGVVP